MLFQSPSGVLGVCRTACPEAIRASLIAFQTPSGVLGVCRVKTREELEKEFSGFSPLPGF